MTWVNTSKMDKRTIGNWNVFCHYYGVPVLSIVKKRKTGKQMVCTITAVSLSQYECSNRNYVSRGLGLY